MIFNDSEFREMEVRPWRSGWYKVTLYHFGRGVYFDDALEYDLEEEEWDYEYYEDTCYVCFIQSKEEN